MTDRENLTALLMAGAGDCLGKGGALNCSKLADYLIEHGVIVPQLNVGDTVYFYDENLNALLDYRINRITLSDSFPTLYSGVCFKEDVFLSDIEFVKSDLGKTVFLSREEAEKALKEREQ